MTTYAREYLRVRAAERAAGGSGRTLRAVTLDDGMAVAYGPPRSWPASVAAALRAGRATFAALPVPPWPRPPPLAADSAAAASDVRASKALAKLKVGRASDRGGCPHMEDETYVEITPGYAFSCVYDGHGGGLAAEFCREQLHLNVLASEAFARADIAQALAQGFERTEAQLLSKQRELASSPEMRGGGAICGTTALVFLLAPSLDGSRDVAHLAWLGDCRAVLCHNGAPRVLTSDHLVRCESERRRILGEGGIVHANRLSGFLEVSRALGDLDYDTGFKPAGLSARPEMVHVPITSLDEFLIMGSDGLWDVMSEVDAVRLAREELRVYGDASMASEKLVEAALKRHTDDNVTAIVVSLNPINDSESGTVPRRPRLFNKKKSNNWGDVGRPLLTVER